MKGLINVLRFAAPYKGEALLSVLFNIIGVAFSLVSMAAIVPVLNILFQLEKAVTVKPEFSWNFNDLKNILYYHVGQAAETHGPLKTLAYICLFTVVLFLLKNLFRYFAMFFLAVVRNGVVRDIRSALYNKSLILPLSYFSEQRKGDIMSRMTTDVQEVEWTIMTSLEMLFRDPVAILWYVGVLFLMNAELTLIVLILLPLTGLLIGKIGKSLKRTSVKGQKKMGELLSLIEESLGGLRIIKGYNAIPWAGSNFRKANNDFYRLMVSLYRKRDLASPLSEFIGIAISVFVIWYGGRIILSGGSTMDAAMFILYIVIFSQLINPVKSLATAAYNVQKGTASVERIQQLLNADELIVEKKDPKPIHGFGQRIEYRNVHFSYGDKEVLTDINLIIDKGRRIALVGPSGGGKSTLVDLLPRFYDPVKGQVLIDGNDLRDLNIKDLRALTGMVSQDTILFNGTVFDNIAFGLENVSEEAVTQAAQIANAHDFIMQMPQGYQTNIGDRGLKMSGGQRQRLSIARAVLKNPPILILDEATSALDTESERLVQEALNNVLANRTSIVIAHRLSTIQSADEIVVMDRGRIVECGNHSELINHNGVYRKLYDLQQFT